MLFLADDALSWSAPWPDPVCRRQTMMAGLVVFGSMASRYDYDP